MRVNPLRNMSCGRLLRSSTVRAQSGAFAPPRPLLSEATDQGGRSPVTPPIRLMLALAVVTYAPLATAGSASASRDQVTILQDDHQLLSANGARRDAALDEWKSLGVDVVKLRVDWRDISPDEKPGDPADPAAYRADKW